MTLRKVTQIPVTQEHITTGKNGKRWESFFTDMDLKQKDHGLIWQVFKFLFSLYAFVFSHITLSIKRKRYFL